MTIKVIGAGLGRTGTLSLKVALEQIGMGPCYHMIEVFAGMPATVKHWEDAIDGQPDWPATFAGFVATVDYPGCTFWREIAAAYPEAKIILSTRDPDSWFESVSETVFSPRMRTGMAGSPMNRFFEGAVYGDFGERIGDREFMTDYFRRWNASVIAEAPPERLLVFEAKQGWAPLCEFLGVPVPDRPYPRVNSREEMGQHMADAAGGQPAAMPRPEQMVEFARMRIAAMRDPAFGAV